MAARIRPAEARDLAGIESVENDADRLLIDRLHPTSWAPAPSGDSRASQPGFLLVVDLGDGRIAGFAHVVEVDGGCHLEQLSVAPEHARQGWGRQLVETAKQQARERGYRQMSLRTYADVPWNAPFYATAGFIEEPPVTPFQLSLVGIEAELGLDRYGRRVQMVAHLATPATPADL